MFAGPWKLHSNQRIPDPNDAVMYSRDLQTDGIVASDAETGTAARDIKVHLGDSKLLGSWRFQKSGHTLVKTLKTKYMPSDRRD